MRLTRHGLREILFTAAPLCAASVFIVQWTRTVSYWLWVPWGLYFIFWLWVLYFFRDPDRPTPDGPGLFISPADGIVADITQLGPDSALGRDGVQIGVFMSVFDVHVNRMPCDGVIQTVTHKDGAYLDVRRPEAYELNESTTIAMTHTHGGVEYPVIVRQIAGLVARRIITNLQTGQAVTRGRRFGMIKFGSRLELLLPKELAGQVRVTIGQKARAGLTILAATEESNDA
ncbi:MAG: phosphatidylserine decarboxylase [Phycisphaerae bacterium]|nr:phosphatidylserine decarboxylase [Phycisphaerae bacterium]